MFEELRELDLPEELQRQHPSIARLTLEEKVRLLTGESMFTLPGNDIIGLAPLAFSDGPTGVRGLKFMGGDAVALFPSATLISGAWDDDISEEVGRLLSEEAHRQSIHVVLGPTVNLHRSPLGGRLFEAYSEDPYLTGRTASAYVRGMQGNGTAACLKHLVANESETLRTVMDSRLSEKALREVYLLPFEMAIQDAGTWSVMAAYNDVNGVTATEHDHVQNQILKGEWSWDGLIMSDWWATKRTVESANGGLDLIMPGPDGPWGDRLVSAVRRGDVAEATVDEHLSRLLLLAERTGAYRQDAFPEADAGKPFKPGMPEPDSEIRKEQLRRIATRGMVLVKNDGDTLPLSNTSSLALIGRHAIFTEGMGGGSAHVNPPYVSSVADAMAARYGDRLAVLDGVAVRSRPAAAHPGFVTDPIIGEPGMHVTYLNASGAELTNRHSDGTAITLGWDDDFEEPATSVILTARLGNEAGPVRLGGIGSGTWTFSSADGILAQTEVIVTGFDPADTMLHAPSYTEVFDLPADALIAVRFDFAGIDWETIVSRPELNFAAESHLLATGSYGGVTLVAEQVAENDDEALAKAEQTARTAGTAVVVVGLTDEDETEAKDKTTLKLPGRQDELVRRVAAAAERTVVVVNAATPVLMPWLSEVDAVLIAGLPGQEGGEAVASVLAGDVEPTGRLVTSYPVEDGASPGWNVTPGPDLAVHYSEGTAVGYRGHHHGLAPEPLFWFGHGLGYGSWDYGPAQLAAGPSNADDAPTITVEVTNTSLRPSRETVQVYFAPDDASQPVRLAGYSGVAVGPRETVSVTVLCERRLFRQWDEASSGWKPITKGELLIARGLGDVRARVQLTSERGLRISGA